MAFLDKLGSLAKNLGDKTNEAIVMSKLNGKITSEKALAETELRIIEVQIGKEINIHDKKKYEL